MGFAGSIAVRRCVSLSFTTCVGRSGGQPVGVFRGSFQPLPAVGPGQFVCKKAMVKLTHCMQTEIWRSVLFQISYALATLQQHLPGFRHNDLSWSNVRTTMPREVSVTREGPGTCPCLSFSWPLAHFCFLLLQCCSSFALSPSLYLCPSPSRSVSVVFLVQLFVILSSLFSLFAANSSVVRNGTIVAPLDARSRPLTHRVYIFNNVCREL